MSTWSTEWSNLIESWTTVDTPDKFLHVPNKTGDRWSIDFSALSCWSLSCRSREASGPWQCYRLSVKSRSFYIASLEKFYEFSVKMAPLGLDSALVHVNSQTELRTFRTGSPPPSHQRANYVTCISIGFYDSEALGWNSFCFRWYGSIRWFWWLVVVDEFVCLLFCFAFKSPGFVALLWPLNLLDSL